MWSAEIVLRETIPATKQFHRHFEAEVSTEGDSLTEADLAMNEIIEWICRDRKTLWRVRPEAESYNGKHRGYTKFTVVDVSGQRVNGRFVVLKGNDFREQTPLKQETTDSRS